MTEEGGFVLLIKAAVHVIQFIGRSSGSSGNILWRRLVVGYDLQTLPDVLIRVVAGEIFLNPVPVFGLTGLVGLFRCAEYLAFLYFSLSLYASCFFCSLCLI